MSHRPSPASFLFAAVTSAAAILVLAGPALASNWRSLGPAPQADGYSFYGPQVSVSGRATAVAYSPNFDGAGTEALFLGTAGGGVWRSTDFTTASPTWTPITDSLGLPPEQENGAITVGSLAVDPFHPNVIYVGTGEANYAGDARAGAGILKSTNGGTTWTLLGADVFGHRSVSRILVDPTDSTGKTVYASMVTGAGAVAGAWGVYKSADGGATWTHLTNGIGSAAMVTDMEYTLDSRRSLTLYAAVGYIYGSGPNGVYRSTDGGATWTRWAGPDGSSVGRIALAADHAPGPAPAVYAVLAPAVGSSGANAVYKSTDGGATWAATNSPQSFVGAQGWYDLATAVSPDGRIYVGGVSAPFNGNKGIQESADGGASWVPIDVGTNNVAPHTDHHAFAVVKGKLYSANDGGIFRFTPAGTHVQPFSLPKRVDSIGRGTGVAAGRIDGDAFADLAIASDDTGNVSIALGHGDGTFSAPVAYKAGNAPVAVALGDLNGDGLTDVITANSGDGTAGVLLNTGATLAAVVPYPTGAGPLDVRIADVNGDKKPDLVTANSGAGTVSVLLGNGDGTFQDEASFAAGTTPYDVVVADFNGDGRPDIATANFGSGSVSVLYGNGDGTFQDAMPYPVGGTPLSIAARDLDGDGKPDIVTADYDVNAVSFLHNNGASFATTQVLPAGPGPDSVAIDDVNGDGKPDIVTANGGAATVSVLAGDGAGHFAAHAEYIAGASPAWIATGDLDGEGHADIITADYGSYSASVLFYRQTTVVGGPSTWESLNTSGLNTTQIEGLALHPTDPESALEGSQDNGTALRTSDGGNVWQTVSDGDGGLVRFDPADGTYAYKVAPQGSFGVYDFFQASSDGGRTWNSRTDTISGDTTFPDGGMDGTGGTASPERLEDTAFPFYPIFTVCPADGARLAIGSMVVYESRDRAVTWQAISNALSSARVSALAYAPGHPDTLYTGFADGSLYRTDDDGGTWTGAMGTGTVAKPWGARRISGIAVDPANPLAAWVAIPSPATGRVWATSDGGATWTDASGDLPAIPAQCIALDARTGALYLGTDNGVWESGDRGAHWDRFGSGLPNVQVLDIQLNAGTNLLGAGTHGRGAWVIGILPGDVNGDGKVDVQDAQLALKAAGGLWAPAADEAVRGSLSSKSGSIRLSDAATVLRRALGL